MNTRERWKIKNGRGPRPTQTGSPTEFNHSILTAPRHPLACRLETSEDRIDWAGTFVTPD